MCISSTAMYIRVYIYTPKRRYVYGFLLLGRRTSGAPSSVVRQADPLNYSHDPLHYPQNGISVLMDNNNITSVVITTVGRPPSSVVKCVWEVFVWEFGVLFLPCVCVGVGVLFSVCVCVCVCVTC